MGQTEESREIKTRGHAWDNRRRYTVKGTRLNCNAEIINKCVIIDKYTKLFLVIVLESVL